MKLHDERGAALPMSIFISALLTVMLAASLTMSSAERQILDNTIAQGDAFTLAQTGLEQFLVNRGQFGFTAAPPAAYESTRVDLSGGYADVVLQQIRPSVAGSAALYVVKSHGVETDPAGVGNPQAERIVAQYAQWQTGTMDVRSSFTSLTGMQKNGGSGTISGVDQCGASGDVAGVSVADPPGYTQNGGSPVPSGSPAIESLGPVEDAVDSVNIDWANIVNLTALTPDVSIPPGGWPSFADPGYWPIIFVEGNFSLPGDGRGTLIVTGSLTINGRKDWEGVLLVGDWITGNGNNGVSGAMVSGLNILLSDDPAAAQAAIGQNSVGNGTKRINYNSCNIAQALSQFGGLSVIPNAWMDNWASY